MEFKQHKSFKLPDRSYQNLVKRDITRLAEGLGFSESEVGKINIIVSEMASNLVKHGTTGGEFLIKTLGEQNEILEIICLDSGPGMSDPQRMLQDGVSTAGTHGEGLGAIKRMAHEFDLFSAPGLGTIILARLFKNADGQKFVKEKVEVGVVMVPKAGEDLCGDGGAMIVENDYIKFLVADGLGHGENAHEASHLASEEFAQISNMGPAETIKTMHPPMKRSRGAVVNVASIHLKNQVLAYCGVGNIAGRVFTPPETIKSLISYNGILGHNIPNSLHNHEVPWLPGSLLVLHSDGIKSKWDISRFRDLMRQDVSLIAAVIFKYFNRGTDDSLVMVGRTQR